MPFSSLFYEGFSFKVTDKQQLALQEVILVQSLKPTVFGPKEDRIDGTQMFNLILRVVDRNSFSLDLVSRDNGH